jgi:hypothetical protein
LLGELADTTVADLELFATEFVHPTRIYQTDGAVLYYLTHTVDFLVDDTTTYDTISIDTGGKKLRIRALQAFDQIHLVAGPTVNADDTSLICEYYDGESQEWSTLTLTENGTKVGGAPFGQTGTIEFSPPSNWAPEPTSGVNYEIRIYKAGAGGIAFDCSDISVRIKHETDTALADIMAHAPAGWALDAVNGYPATEIRTPIGSELITTNGGFETFTGTIGDGVTDVFTGWNNYYINDGTGDRVEAVSSPTHSGSYAMKISSGATYNVQCMQFVSVTAKKDITVSYWTGAGGTGQAALRILDATHLHDLLTPAIDSGVTGADWEQVSVTFTVPDGCTAILVDFFCPITLGTYAYIDDVSVKEGGGATVYLEMAGESVLEALKRVAEQVGEHFTGGYSNRNVLWLQDEERSNNLRATIVDEPVLADDNAEIVLIMNHQLQHDSHDLISRIYPYGTGTGDERTTLEHCTRPVPAGYTLNATSNYLERDTATTAYGYVVEKQHSFPDIKALNETTTQLERASNALFDAAYEYLRTHSAQVLDRTNASYDVPRFATVTVAKCDHPLWPGHMLDVAYDRWVDGYHVDHIGEKMRITEVTNMLDANGAHSVQLKLASVDRAQKTASDETWDWIKGFRKAAAHTGSRVPDGTYTSVVVRGGQIVGGS